MNKTDFESENIHPARVLVVEDEAHTRKGLAILLQEEGYEVATAANGREALQIVAAWPVDIVLCDYRLPGEDGLSVCQRLSSIKNTIAQFLVTAYLTPELRGIARAAGIEKIFCKPINVEELLCTLSTVANRPSPRNSLTLAESEP